MYVATANVYWSSAKKIASTKRFPICGLSGLCTEPSARTAFPTLNLKNQNISQSNTDFQNFAGTFFLKENGQRPTVGDGMYSEYEILDLVTIWLIESFNQPLK